MIDFRFSIVEIGQEIGQEIKFCAVCIIKDAVLVSLLQELISCVTYDMHNDKIRKHGVTVLRG